mmetsp:Transcript_40014/g.55612  ORF Transcript_40014/g.55612 Transcript_40014/m.55612 type:complete len:279 (+) Transcript_40014:39-875(+)|eukprot:CAMPEP_0196584554 /NCGR_PEP_ID=MMETSP1081-20130531/47548_1 /TAXON_ID=36882 /ORGANISM="Pyramimonas amylifera, Strain CCMP720" /LENGTH=278 /DNA_ID=CAMNT_0041905797 /DNA_START=33 /DNA_END=869 /DNA_ORIENTATION=+
MTLIKFSKMNSVFVFIYFFPFASAKSTGVSDNTRSALSTGPVSNDARIPLIHLNPSELQARTRKLLQMPVNVNPLRPPLSEATIEHGPCYSIPIGIPCHVSPPPPPFHSASSKQLEKALYEAHEVKRHAVQDDNVPERNATLPFIPGHKTKRQEQENVEKIEEEVDEELEQLDAKAASVKLINKKENESKAKRKGGIHQMLRESLLNPSPSLQDSGPKVVLLFALLLLCMGGVGAVLVSKRDTLANFIFRPPGPQKATALETQPSDVSKKLANLRRFT